MATDILVQDQILPTVSNNIGSECAENVISAVSSLYRAKIPLDINRDLGQECVTNCVLTVSNSKICDISVLLLEDVFRGEVINFLNDLAAKQTDVCVIGLECCGQSQPLPSSICGESKWLLHNWNLCKYNMCAWWSSNDSAVLELNMLYRTSCTCSSSRSTSNYHSDSAEH